MLNNIQEKGCFTRLNLSLSNIRFRSEDLKRAWRPVLLQYFTKSKKTDERIEGTKHDTYLGCNTSSNVWQLARRKASLFNASGY